MSERAKQLLAEATNSKTSEIPADARIGRCRGWDSLAHLHLVLAIERQIGRQLDPDEAVHIETLADIATLLVSSTQGANL